MTEGSGDSRRNVSTAESRAIYREFDLQLMHVARVLFGAF